MTCKFANWLKKWKSLGNTGREAVQAVVAIDICETQNSAFVPIQSPATLPPIAAPSPQSLDLHKIWMEKIWDSHLGGTVKRFIRRLN